MAFRPPAFQAVSRTKSTLAHGLGSKLLRPRLPARHDRPVKAALDPESISTAVNVAAGASNPLSGITNNLTSLLVLAVIVAVHEMGHFIGARSQGIKVRNFSIGFGPRLLSFKEGPEDDDIEYTLRAIPMGGFVSFPPHYEIDNDGDMIRYEDKDLLQNRPPLQQAIVISAGVIANILLSFSLLLGSVATTGLPRPQFSDGPYVMRLVEKDCPAARAGIQPEDLILAVNGHKVSGDEKGLNGAVSLISQSNGQPVELQLRRKGVELLKTVTPQLNPETGRNSIGVQMAAHIEKVKLIKAKDPAQALEYSVQELGAMLREASSSLRRFSSAGMEGLTGPLGIVQVGADLAAVDQLALIKFAAFISINLAVVNALPFPGLDGGQMIFVLLEALRGKRLSPQLENGINAVAVLLLASLSLSLIAGDITRGMSSLDKVIEANPLLDSPLK